MNRLPPHFESLEKHLGKYPTLFLVRHAERPHIAPGTTLADTFAVRLTDQGRLDSNFFGSFLRQKHPELTLAFAMSSPVPRNLETAINFIQGGKYYPDGQSEASQIQESIIIDSILVGRGLYSREAGQSVINDPSLMTNALRGEFPIGEKPIRQTGEDFMKFLTGKLDEQIKEDDPTAFGMAFTHDMIMALLTCRYFDVHETGDKFPKLLEAFLIQRLPDGKHRFVWREEQIDF